VKTELALKRVPQTLADRHGWICGGAAQSGAAGCGGLRGMKL